MNETVNTLDSFKFINKNDSKTPQPASDPPKKKLVFYLIILSKKQIKLKPKNCLQCIKLLDLVKLSTYKNVNESSACSPSPNPVPTTWHGLFRFPIFYFSLQIKLTFILKKQPPLTS